MAEPLEGNPLDILARWVDEAADAGLGAPSAMTFATADDDGVPHARTVLVTAIDGATVRFHSSTPTTKTRDVAARGRAAGVFHWPALGRQVVAQGSVRELSPGVSRAAFADRPRQLQLVAWAYEELLPRLEPPDDEVPAGAVRRAFDAAALRGEPLEMPPSWTTLEVTPDRMDFWQAGEELVPPSKMRFTRSDAGSWRRFSVLP